MAGILSSIFFILALFTSFLTTSFFTASLSLLKSTRTSTNPSTSNLSTLFLNCLNHLAHFLIFQNLICPHQILSLLNQPFQQIQQIQQMYQHLLNFLNLHLLHNQINPIQLSLFLLRILVLENLNHLYYIFFIYRTVKRTIVSFPFNIQSIAFSLYYFFNSKLFLICFLQLFFIEHSSTFFALTITNNICPRYNVFNLFNHKKLFMPIRNIYFCKNVFIF